MLIQFIVMTALQSRPAHGKLSRDVAQTAKKQPKMTRALAPRYAKVHGLTPRTLNEKFTATGGLRCGEYMASAQVTKSRKLITTAGHVVVGKLDCSKVNLATCVFTLEGDQAPLDFKIKRRVADGLTLGCDEKRPVEDRDDWAVPELEQAVPNTIEPYKVDRAVTRAIQAGSEVTSVGRSLDIQKPKTTGSNILDYPKHYSDCAVTSVKVLWAGDDPDLFNTSCWGGGGNSGGSLLDPAGDGRTLVGVFVGSERNFSQAYYAPVSGKFLTAIESYVEGNSP